MSLLTAIGLAGGVLSIVPTQTWADEPRDPRDPDARLQVIVKTIKVIDDHDWGQGDMHYTAEVVKAVPCENGSKECQATLAATAAMDFGASDGQTVTLNRPLPDPRPGAKVLDATVSPDIGFPVWADKSYQLRIKGTEVDTLVDDQMGTVLVNLKPDDNWHIGTWSERGIRGWTDCFPSLACHFGFEDGDATVTYEVRQMPLPDLRPSQLERRGKVGSDDQVCFKVENVGSENAGDFPIVVRLDGGVAPNGVIFADGLNKISIREFCIATQLPPNGLHKLSVTVDEGRVLAEENELNNYQEIPLGTIDLTGPIVPRKPTVAGNEGVTDDPTDPPAENKDPADLVVDEIRVKGKDASGSNDCDPGKNDVVVGVKNKGETDALNVVVRLLIDNKDNLTKEQTVAKVSGGQSTDVTFSGVDLSAGNHFLEVTVDPTKVVKESKEDNNDRDRHVNCAEEKR